MAKGLAKALSAEKRGSTGSERRSPESDAGAQASPAPATPGPASSRAATGDAVFKRPGPLSSKKKKVRPMESMDLTGDSSSDDVSGSVADMTPFSDMSSDTNRALGCAKKRGRSRPSTTGEWVGVEAVRQKLALLKKEHERVVAERDVLVGKFEVDFGQTAGKIPSANDVMEGLADETVDSLLNIVLEEMEAVERVAERSGSLRGTFKGRLRAASRRAVAASKLLFMRANTCAREDEGTRVLERARRELQVAKGLLGESREKIGRLEGEVEVLKAKKTLRASAAERVSPPPCWTPTFRGAARGGANGGGGLAR